MGRDFLKKGERRVAVRCGTDCSARAGGAGKLSAQRSSRNSRSCVPVSASPHNKGFVAVSR
jgi:hypothetical protein